jgi:hypothetical protein
MHKRTPSWFVCMPRGLHGADPAALRHVTIHARKLSWPRAGVHEMGEMDSMGSGRVSRGGHDPVWSGGEGSKAGGAVVLHRCRYVDMEVLVVGDSGERGCFGVGVAVIQGGG